MDETRICTLSEVAEGSRVTVVAMRGGRAFQSRLIAMGLKVGSPVTVLRNSPRGQGPTLVAAGESRLAIGHGMAERIMVTADPPRGGGGRGAYFRERGC